MEDQYVLASQIYSQLITTCDSYEVRCDKLTILNFYTLFYMYLGYYDEGDVVDHLMDTQVNDPDICWEIVEKFIDQMNKMFEFYFPEMERHDFRFLIHGRGESRDIFMLEVMDESQFNLRYPRLHFPLDMFRGSHIERRNSRGNYAHW